MNKGINTCIVDFKKELADKINQYLKEGVPVSVVDLALDNLIVEVKQVLKETLEKESQQADAVAEQVVYEPENGGVANE